MRLVVGVIGHVDHGKTALVRSLTGTETDRLAEEKRRGISIALGFAFLPIPGGTIDLIDMPGHERFVRTMVSGATGMAAALLVVAANEGIKPQTREHLDIAALLGVGRVVVAISKADLDPAAAVAAEAVVAAEVRRRGMTVAGSVVTSATTGEGVEALRAALATAAVDVPPPADDGFFLLPIDRAFSITGHGTVVTGTLRRGPLAVSDEIALEPGGRRLRLRALQVNGARTALAVPGQRVAANLRDVEPSQVPRGAALCAPGVLRPATWLSVMLEAVPSAPELRNGALLTLLVGTAEVGVRLRLLDRDVLAAGERCIAQLHGAAPVATPARERFILRRPSPAQTVAGGRILDPDAGRVRRLRPGTSPSADFGRLAAMADAEPARILRMLVDRAGTAGVSLARASQWAGVSKTRATMLLAAAPVAIVGGAAAVTRSGLDEAVRALPRALERRPDGVARERLPSLLPGVGAAVLDAALAILGQRGVVRSGGGTVQLRRPDQERDAARDEAAAAAKLAESLRRAGLSPPDLGALAPDKRSERLVNRLIREGLAVRTVDVVQKRDVVFHRDAVETAKVRLRPHLSRPPGLLVGEAGAVLGISRKFSVPLLEHLDAIRFTRRLGDRRVIAVPASAQAPPG